MLHKSLAVILVLLFFVSQASAKWGQKTEKGSGNLETVSIDLKEFNRIQSAGSADIFVKIGGSQKIELTCDDNIIDNITMEVRGKRLIIESEGSFSVSKSPRIDITIPELESMSIAGSGDVEIRGLDGGEFTYSVSGSGDLTAEGKVDYLELRLSGSGDMDTRKLIAREVDCKIAGSGDIEVYAAESFNGSISGSGDITLYGDPKYVDRFVSGSGSIRKR